MGGGIYIALLRARKRIAVKMCPKEEETKAAATVSEPVGLAAIVEVADMARKATGAFS